MFTHVGLKNQLKGTRNQLAFSRGEGQAATASALPSFMRVSDAMELLGFEGRTKPPSREEIVAKYENLMIANQPKTGFAGSRYLQSHIHHAYRLLRRQPTFKEDPEEDPSKRESIKEEHLS